MRSIRARGLVTGAMVVVAVVAVTAAVGKFSGSADQPTSAADLAHAQGGRP